MHIGFNIVGNIVIDDVADAAHIEAARRDIGGHQDIQLPAFQPLDGLLPLLLRNITVEGGGGIAARRQFVSQFGGENAGAHKNNHPVEVLHLEDTGQGIELVHPRHHPHPLADGRTDDALHLDRDFPRVREVALGNPADRVGHGGGEQGDLSLIRCLFQDPLDIVYESHTEHLIGLIEHQCLQPGEVQRATSHMVHDTARGADHYMYAALQLSQLAAHVRAAVNRQHVKTRQVARIFLEGLGYLDCQFPRGCEDQYLGQLLPEIEPRKDRQREGCGLTGAGLGLAQYVGAFEHVGDNPCLDSGGRFIADLRQGFLQGRGQIQFGKTGNPIWSGHSGTLSGERGAQTERGRGLYRETAVLSGRTNTRKRPTGRI